MFQLPRLGRSAPTALTAAVVLLCSLSGAAAAATVPLNGRSFNQACQESGAGDVVAVPPGSYGNQTLSCAKAVTFSGTGPGVVLTQVTFQGAAGPAVENMTIDGVDAKGASNITVRNSRITDQTYLEGTRNVLFDHITWEPKAAGQSWGNSDMVNIYPASDGTPNRDVTIQDSVLHGLRATSSSAHPDAIQLYNDGQPHTGIRLLRNRFYDNECINLRANPGDEILLENNVFGDSAQGVTGCHYYAIDVGYANVTARYNTFPGRQEIQQTPTAGGLHQVWVGNVGAGFSEGCNSGGAAGATVSHNVWRLQKCGMTDRRVSALKVNPDGTPQSGSPVIDAGDPAIFPAGDFNGASRPRGLAPDAGAFETGQPLPPPPPPPAGGGAPLPGGGLPVDVTPGGVLTFTPVAQGATTRNGARPRLVTIRRGRPAVLRVKVHGLKGHGIRSARLKIRVVSGERRHLFIRGAYRNNKAVRLRVRKGWAQVDVSRRVRRAGSYRFVVITRGGPATIAGTTAKTGAPRLAVKVR